MKKLILQTSFFKGHIQTKIVHSDSTHFWWWEWGRGGGGWLVAENYKQTLENKESLRAAALLLNVSEHRYPKLTVRALNNIILLS